MKLLITAARVRSVISGCTTEKELVSSLRCHKIRYSFSTDTGTLAIRIPCRKGYIRIFRTASRSCPFRVTHDAPSPFLYPVPVLHNDY